MPSPLQLQPLRPDLHGIYNLKYNDQSWALSLISLQGCYLRIAKITINNRNCENVEKDHVHKYFSEKFIQVRICPDSPCLYDLVGKGSKTLYSAAIVNVVGTLYDSSLVSIKISFKTQEEGTLWHLALEKGKTFISRQATSGDMQSLIDLSFRMKSSVSIRDRFHYLTVYSRCFVGSEAVHWIQSDQHCTEVEAVELGNRMVNVNLIYHVQHNRFFLNSPNLYRFNKHSLRDIVERLRSPIGIIPDLAFSNSKRFISSQHSTKAPEEKPEHIPESEDVNHSFDAPTNLEYMTLRSTTVSSQRLKRAHLQTLIELRNLKELLEEQHQTLYSYKFILAGLICVFIIHIVLRERYNCSISVLVALYISSLIFFAMLKQMTRPDESHDRSTDDLEEQGAALTSSVLDDDGHYLQEIQDKDLLSIPSPSTWPNRPILVRRSPSVFFAGESDLKGMSSQERDRVFRLTRPLQIHCLDPEGSVIDLDSDIFTGKLYTIFAGLRDSPMKFFRTKKRLFEVIVQGKFKKSVPFCEVYTGQIFSKPFSYLPPDWLTRMILMLLSQLQPALQVSLDGSTPYILSPLASTAKHILVNEAGQQPLLSELIGNCPEEMSLVDVALLGMSSQQRVKFFSQRSNLLKYSYSPDYVYTFDFYQHVFNLATMKIDIGVTTIDVLQVIGKAPVQIMSVHWDPFSHPNALVESLKKKEKIGYLYNVEVWHEKALPLEDQRDEESEHKENI